MSVTWANPLGYNIIAIRRCKACGRQDARTLWSRPLAFAGSKTSPVVEATPLTIQEMASMLRDAPFQCLACTGKEAGLIAISVDETAIPF